MTLTHCQILIIYCILAYTTLMCQCDDETNFSMDLKTPRNVLLTPFYKRSFAFYTMKNRLPVILTQAVDIMVRYKDDIVGQYGEASREELKQVIGEMSKLKYEIQTNKPLRALTSNAPDVKFYNQYLDTQTAELGEPTFFNSIWLHGECYTYRRMRETLELTNTLKTYDPFKIQKEQTYANSSGAMEQLAKHLLFVVDQTNETKNISEEFIRLLKLNLWGNKYDLSISNGTVGAATEDIVSKLNELEPYIISDYSDEVWSAISDSNATSEIIDIVLDNAGYELFSDLCLADFILSNNLAKQIRFYVKTIPWFVSDVTFSDFHWMIQQLQKSSVDELRTVGDRWKKYVDKSNWTILMDDFWILPVDFTYMATVNPDLYKTLSQAKLIFFKGDLNYRKLFGEKNWSPTTEVNVGLQGFNPSKLCTLRTVKCDLICGLEAGVTDKLDHIDGRWMETGSYGVIQFSDKVILI